MITLVRARRSSLDLLRALAIMQVFLYHILYRWSTFTGLAFSAFSKQWLGVNLFFILSGYLICSSMSNSQNRIAFVQKRLKRILPAYYMTILVIVSIYLLRVYNVDYNGWNKGNFYLSALLNVFFIPAGIIDDYFYIDGVFWSLIVEIQFYIVCALMWNKKEHLKLLLLAMSIVAYAFPGLIDQFFPIARYAPWFLIGVSVQKNNKIYLLIAIFLCLISFYDDILGLFFAILNILLFLLLEKREKVMDLYLLRILAFYSYEIYLIHQTLMFISLEYFEGIQFIISSVLLIVIGSFILSKLSSYVLFKLRLG